MTPAVLAPLAAARDAWRRDRALLLPLAGLTMFLPQLAVQLLLPDLPAAPAERDEAAMRVWMEGVQAWAGSNGGWYLLAPLAAMLGALTVFALYLGTGRPTLGAAFARAGRLFLRYLLASILVSLPMGAMLSITLSVPFLLVFAAGPIFYIYGRTMLAGPVIVAEAPTGAVAAIARSWALTRGQGWVLAAIYATLFLVPGLVGSIALSLASMGGGNPVVVALGAGIACAATAIAALALALVQVVVYRRVARQGT